MSFELAQKVADAVLYEGYVLYPYRASSAKNRVRWQFGVVVPRAYAELGGSEPWAMQTECLIEPRPEGTAEIDLRVRFLQVQARTIEESLDAGGSAFRPVETLAVGDQTLVTWEEGVERRLDATALSLADLLAGEQRLPIEVSAGREVQLVQAADGGVAARIVRERWPVSAVVSISARPEGGLVKVQIRIENRGAWDGEGGREGALRRSLVGAHTLLAVRGGAFVSLLDPPPEAAAAAAACANQHTWPVLVGPEGTGDVLLSSPIILYDHPAVAAESPGDFCDSTEIDEILTLRVMTLTDEEKREARGTDERSRQIIERSDNIPPEVFERLHGAIRGPSPPSPLSHTHSRPPGRGGTGQPQGLPLHLEHEAVTKTVGAGLVPALGGGAPLPGEGSACGRGDGGEGLLAELSAWESFLNPTGEVPPEEASIEVGTTRVAKGARVRLRPKRCADSMDFFLAGREARVEGIYCDLEDATWIAVSLEGDPAGDLQSSHGRFFYFDPEEVEPLESDSEGRPDETSDPGCAGVAGGGGPHPVAAGHPPVSENLADVTPRTLVACVGNIFLGDDAFGVEVARRLAGREIPDGVRVADFGIRGVHLAYEMAERSYETVILVDAVPRGGEPGTVYLIEPDLDRLGAPAASAADAHGMDPGTVFALLETLGGKPGRVLVVGCEPATIEEGIGLSEPVAAAVDEAVAMILGVLGQHTTKEGRP